MDRTFMTGYTWVLVKYFLLIKKGYLNLPVFQNKTYTFSPTTIIISQWTWHYTVHFELYTTWEKHEFEYLKDFIQHKIFDCATWKWIR